MKVLRGLGFVSNYLVMGLYIVFEADNTLGHQKSDLNFVVIIKGTI